MTDTDLDPGATALRAMLARLPTSTEPMDRHLLVVFAGRCYLDGRQPTVADLADVTGIRASVVGRRLRTLRRGGLVDSIAADFLRLRATTPKENRS